LKFSNKTAFLNGKHFVVFVPLKLQMHLLLQSLFQHFQSMRLLDLFNRYHHGVCGLNKY
jgi:hypothetical protein